MKYGYFNNHFDHVQSVQTSLIEFTSSRLSVSDSSPATWVSFRFSFNNSLPSVNSVSDEEHSPAGNITKIINIGF